MRFARIYLLSVIVLFVLLGCSSPEKEFKNTKAKNTFEAYEEYLKNYPDTPFKSEIEDSIRSLDFKKAVSENTITAYENFIEKYQNSEFEEKVNGKIRSLMGRVKGTFISKHTKKPVDLKPILFNIFDEDQTEEEKARSEKYKIDIKYESPGNFFITNVLPGKYSLFVMLPSYGFKSVGSVFEVSSDQLVDLGKIEIDKK